VQVGKAAAEQDWSEADHWGESTLLLIAWLIMLYRGVTEG
jgi:hypothetical protein